MPSSPSKQLEIIRASSVDCSAIISWFRQIIPQLPACYRAEHTYEDFYLPNNMKYVRIDKNPAPT